MRIAIVSDYFLDYVGGAQTSMFQQQLALQEAGHVAFLVAASNVRGKRFRTSVDHFDVKPDFTLPGFRLPIIPNSKRTRDALESFFRDERVDVVHVQTEFGLAHAAAEVAHRLGIPVIHTVHTFYWASDGSWHAPLAPLVRSLLQRFLSTTIGQQRLSSRPVDNVLRNMVLSMAEDADMVISPSAHQARDLRAAGVDTPVEVVPNPIATSTRPSHPLSREQATTPAFLWVARCESVKRPLVFAKAAVDALATKPGAFTVDFVGEGAELGALERMTRDSTEITVHGNVIHDRVLALMDQSAAMVLTSMGFDNQPMTVAEAVSRERGVLYCDPKLSEGLAHAGHLADAPDAAGLTRALLKLSSDPDALLRLSEGAGIDRELFSPQRYVETVTELYERAAASLGD